MLMQRETELTKRLMERTSLFFIVLFLLMMLSSCKLGFESTKFYNQRRRNVDISVDVGTEDESDEKISDMDSLDKDKINKLFEDAEKNKDAPFPANKFDDWVFYFVDLTNQNVGTYRFDNSGTWTDDGNHGEIFSNGKAVGSGVRILNDVKYYRYKDRAARWQAVSYTDFDPFTPELDPDGKLKKREERFLFFRFTAQSGAGPLDNTMLCVDTYTKFCWYYAEPAWLDSILGNKVPKDWVDFESPVISTSGECEHTRSYGKFYYYDPVGYVQEDGSVVLYDWAKNDLEAGYFNPRQNYSETATRAPDGAGKSPYFSLDAKEAEAMPQVTVPSHDAGLLVQMNYVHNESFKSIEQTTKTELSYAYLFVRTKNSISNETVVFPNRSNILECKKIGVKENAELTTNNSFLLKLSDLERRGSFELKTDTAFANQLWSIGHKAAQASSVGNELNTADSCVAQFSFVPASGTDFAYLCFNGIKNVKYNANGFTTEITSSLAKNEKLPLDKPITFTLTYTVNGTLSIARPIIEKRNVTDAQFSVTYTLDFTDGEK